jgi:Xaa-Pro aminopeptidase
MLEYSESEASPTAARIGAFREELKRRSLDGFIVPRQDEFQGEYVAPYAERLRWLTGFAGSWGLAIILQHKAAIFVDGRYTLQVAREVDTTLITPHHLVEQPPHSWIENNVAKDQVIGYDPWLLTAEQVSRFEQSCAKVGARLEACENVVDTVWTDRPARPNKAIEVQPTQFAGRTSAEKVAEVAGVLEKEGADAVVLTLPDSIAWLFNIRGQDVRHIPVVHAQAIVHRTRKADLFLDPIRVPNDMQDHFASVANLHPPHTFVAALEKLGQGKAKVIVDFSTVPQRVCSSLKSSGAEIVNAPDPTLLPKARKNLVEREGARAAHRRDGAAMAQFLHWLDVNAPKGDLTELAAADQLHEFRRATGSLKDLSFDTIPGAGPNAAIPHYHVSAQSNRKLDNDSIFLIDSGAQYQDGTTDVTRTVIIGRPTAEMKDRYTRVLKGMIGISTIRFPKGTTGSQLDVLARAALWSAGLDYDHGTGHGVGSYLSVHEGPARLNKTDRTQLEPGMILSNEPGYYKAGNFGIRTENLLLIHEPQAIAGGERPMMGFETLTLVPIDNRLIEPSLLTEEEIRWLNDYHARVLKEIGPLLEGADLQWLQNACTALRK